MLNLSHLFPLQPRRNVAPKQDPGALPHPWPSSASTAPNDGPKRTSALVWDFIGLFIPLARGHGGSGGLRTVEQAEVADPRPPDAAAILLLSIAPALPALNYSDFRLSSVSGALRWVNLFPRRCLGCFCGGFCEDDFQVSRLKRAASLQLSVSHRGSSPSSRAPYRASPNRGQSRPA